MKHLKIFETKENKLEELQVQYKKNIQWDNNKYSAAEEAAEKVFGYQFPYIHHDANNEPTHIFYNDEVLFFNDGIYTKK